MIHPRTAARLWLIGLALALSAMGPLCGRVRGQSIVGPSEVAVHRLARLSIAWPEEHAPGKAAWLVVPIDGADFAAFGDHLVLTGTPGRYDVIASVVVDGMPAFLTHRIAIEGEGPSPTPTPTPTPPRPGPPPRPEPPRPNPAVTPPLWAILLYDDAALTPHVAALRSNPLLSELDNLGARWAAYEVDSAAARASNLTRELPQVKALGGVPVILMIDHAGVIHDAMTVGSAADIVRRVNELTGVR